ncbi:MAG TPA: polyprenyl synthetase family protein [Elusimicrobiales bacterium]|nr:polyprenyl synthetase family protein [Elusimicrobiales bacterium]
MNNFKNYLNSKAEIVEKALDKYIKQSKDAPQIIIDAMQYSLNAGGKRLRPVLVMLGAECFGVKPSCVLPCACAVEMIHTYSLIHDDMPIMDNDSLRRGKPTNHKVFGEDAALLAGDGLLTYAFETAAQNAKQAGAVNTLKAISHLAYSAGINGMVGGQVSDIYAENLTKKTSARISKLLKKNYFKNKKPGYFLLPKNQKLTKENLLFYVHAHKTAELIKASVQMGAALAGAKNSDFKNITEYGKSIGMAFQITDDILDVTASAKKLGKSTSDDKLKKLTFVTLFGLDEAKKQARKYILKAKKSLGKIKTANGKIKLLYDLADFILERSY